MAIASATLLASLKQCFTSFKVIITSLHFTINVHKELFVVESLLIRSTATLESLCMITLVMFLLVHSSNPILIATSSAQSTFGVVVPAHNPNNHLPFVSRHTPVTPAVHVVVSYVASQFSFAHWSIGSCHCAFAVLSPPSCGTPRDCNLAWSKIPKLW